MPENRMAASEVTVTRSFRSLFAVAPAPPGRHLVVPTNYEGLR
jgi:hypothetical protein